MTAKRPPPLPDHQLSLKEPFWLPFHSPALWFVLISTESPPSQLYSSLSKPTVTLWKPTASRCGPGAAPPPAGMFSTGRRSHQSRATRAAESLPSHCDSAQ